MVLSSSLLEDRRFCTEARVVVSRSISSSLLLLLLSSVFAGGNGGVGELVATGAASNSLSFCAERSEIVRIFNEARAKRASQTV